MRYLKSIFLFIMVCCLLSCGSKSKDPKPPTPPDPVPPTNETTKAVLVTPAKDEACTTGISLNSTTNRITFKWIASAFAKDYTITAKNLVTSELTSATTTDTQIDLVLTKNVAYTWSVKTKSSLNTNVVDSDVWRFYNAGEATSSYAPYPADLTAPAMDAKLSATSTKTDLTWKGADPDADILNYDIYFGTTTSPPLFKSDYTSTTLSVTISSTNTYYWKIVTKDKLGNKSESPIYKFGVL